MVNGERCTTGLRVLPGRHPPSEPRRRQDEPARVAEAVARMGLDFAVVTTVARDDLPDEGAGQVAATDPGDPRRAAPGTSVEVLISDCRGRPRPWS